MNILLVDITEHTNYDFAYMQSHPLRGTESSALRLARALAENHTVYFSQVNRTEPYSEYGITYINLEQSKQLATPPDIVIIMRKHKLLKLFHTLYPQAKKFVWLQNFQKPEILGRRHWMVKANATLVCVSQNQRDYINNIVNGPLSWLFRLLSFKFKEVPVTYVYNTIADEYVPQPATVDPNKLFFFSSAYKGLDQVLRHFARLLQYAPDYKLYLANSREALDSFNLDKTILDSGSVIFLGGLSKDQIIEQLRTSFCVYYPQSVHPETFGLVYAEANCVGTPVLAHDFGSAAEILASNHEQLVDADDNDAVLQKMLDWQKNGRPEVHCDEIFKISGAIKEWNRVLGLD